MECTNYSSLTSGDRKTTNITRPKSKKCDSSLNGWYRFQGAAGTRMPTLCPPRNRCSSYGTGWLTGGHPTVAKGNVTRKVCFHYTSGWFFHQPLKWETAALSMFTTSVVHQTVPYATVAVTNCSFINLDYFRSSKSSIHFCWWIILLKNNLFVALPSKVIGNNTQALFKEASSWVNLGLCWLLLWIHQSLSQKSFSMSIIPNSDLPMFWGGRVILFSFLFFR